MEYWIEPSEDRTYIVLTVIGDFTAETFMNCIVETHMRGMAQGIHRYLVDVRRARNVDTPYKTYKFAYADMPVTEGVDLV